MKPKAKTKPPVSPDWGREMRDRPSVIVDIEGRARGSAQPGERIQARRVLDALYERMHFASQLSDRQFVAVRDIARLRWGARLDASKAARYDQGRGVTHATDIDEPGAEDVYHRAMKWLTSPQQGFIIGLIEGQHPGVKWLASAQAACERLADALGVERNPDPFELLVVDGEHEK